MGLLVVVLMFCCCLSGCSVLPGTLHVSQDEVQETISRFKSMIDRQRQCHCCVDARARVTFKSLLHNGSINGYLQAMMSSSFKFVGVNPFGQPLVVLTTDGHSFTYLSVPESKGYVGKVSGETFTKYAPHGFQPDQAFSLLMGRLAPGIIQIWDVSRDEKGQGFWFRLTYKNKETSGVSLVLFEPGRQLIRRHLIVDEGDEVMMNIFYDEYNDDLCPLPGRVTVRSLQLKSSMELSLQDWLDDAFFVRADFAVRLPAAYERVIVK